MNIPCTATLVDGTRVHGRLIVDTGEDRHVFVYDNGAASWCLFADDAGQAHAWASIDTLDTAFDARSRGGQSRSEAKRAASIANGAQPVKPGSKPRGRPRKDQSK
jgi:hypothetical protein